MAVRRPRTARARRKQLVPEATSTLIDSTLRFLKLDETVRSMRAMRAFGLVAGPRILARARAERLRGRTLHVRVASSAWSQELHLLRTAILERLKQTPGGEVVEDLRFQVGDVSELPEWVADPTAPSPTLERSGPPVASALYEAIAQIPDGELRERFATLVGRANRRAR